MVDIDFY